MSENFASHDAGDHPEHNSRSTPVCSNNERIDNTSEAHTPEERQPSGRRGVLAGLVTAGAAVVVGGALDLIRRHAPDSASGVTATGRIVEVTLTVKDMRFVPDTVDVAAGDHLILTLHNTADQVHDLVLSTGATTGRVGAGQTARLDAGIVTEPLEGWCSIAGHRAQGMAMRVTTGGSLAGASSDRGVGESHSEDSSAEGMKGAHEGAHGEHSAHAAATGSTLDLQAPLPDDVTPYDAVLPSASDETVHRVTFTVTEVDDVYVGAGVRQTRWTFNGTSPGPILRGHVGDTFEITLVNNGSMSHSIDFHAGIVSPDQMMRSIDPGESLVYTFTAEHAGIWLYHCSTTPMSMHIAAGMYGAVVIDPDGLAPVDREYILVQSETYLGLDSATADTTAMSAKIAAKTPDLMCFNGVAFQYHHAPLPATTGERVRIWVLAAGPSLPCSFHIVGLQFDTVFHEGTYLLGGPEEHGRAWRGGSQALWLGPAQGGFVEARVPAPGHYSMCTHAFADMEKGAMAVLEVTD